MLLFQETFMGQDVHLFTMLFPDPFSWLSVPSNTTSSLQTLKKGEASGEEDVVKVTEGKERHSTRRTRPETKQNNQRKILPDKNQEETLYRPKKKKKKLQLFQRLPPAKFTELQT